jgi:hypothetical protein
MLDDESKVTTFCPRCGKPIVWQGTDAGADTLRMEVAGWSCHCPLSDEDWGALGAEAAEALREREQAGTEKGSQWRLPFSVVPQRTSILASALGCVKWISALKRARTYPQCAL